MTTINGRACVVNGKAVDKVFSNGKQVYGKNYIISSKLNSFAPYNTKPVATNGGKTITTTYVSTSVTKLAISIDNFVPENKQYTLSGKMTINGVPVTNDTFVNAMASTYNVWYDTNKKKISADGSFYFTETYSGTSVLIMHTSIKGIKAGDVVVIEGLKFETGDVATPWTPAPEDVLKGDITAPNNLVVK